MEIFNRAGYKLDENGQMVCWLAPPMPNNRHEGMHNTGNPFNGVGEWRDCES